jgi:hypothetical protein
MNPFRRFVRRNTVGFPLGQYIEALRAAPRTELPISDRAREILAVMAKGWRRKAPTISLAYTLASLLLNALCTRSAVQ